MIHVHTFIRMLRERDELRLHSYCCAISYKLGTIGNVSLANREFLYSFICVCYRHSHLCRSLLLLGFRVKVSKHQFAENDAAISDIAKNSISIYKSNIIKIETMLSAYFCCWKFSINFKWFLGFRCDWFLGKLNGPKVLFWVRAAWLTVAVAVAMCILYGLMVSLRWCVRWKCCCWAQSTNQWYWH